MGSKVRAVSLAITIVALCSDRVDTFSLSTTRRCRRSSVALRERSTADPSLQPIYEGLSRYRNVRKETETLYDVLRCSSDATREELRRSYIDLARETHPDALIAFNGGYDGVGAERGFSTEAVGASSSFEEVAHAWKVLSDDTERMRYDKRLQAKRLTTVFEALVSWAGDLVESFIPPPVNTLTSEQSQDGSRYVENWEVNDFNEEHYLGSEQNHHDQRHVEKWDANEFVEESYVESDQIYHDQRRDEPWEANEFNQEYQVESDQHYHDERYAETWRANQVNEEYFVESEQNYNDQGRVDSWEVANSESDEPPSDNKWKWKFW